MVDSLVEDFVADLNHRWEKNMKGAVTLIQKMKHVSYRSCKDKLLLNFHKLANILMTFAV